MAEPSAATPPAPTGPRDPLARAARLAAAVALATAALLGAAEGLARALVTPRPERWLAHPFLGRIRPPNASYPKVCFEDGAPFDYRTNALGMRGASVTAVKKPAGTYRIFFVGGSTTENSNLPEERTFPALVEKALSERWRGSPRVEVSNAGVGGASSAAAVAQVSQRVLALEPDLVVSLEGNDFFDALRDDWDPAQLELGHHRPVRFMDWLQDSSRLLEWLDRFSAAGIEDDLRPAMKRRTEKRRKRAVADPPEDVLTRGCPGFERNLHSIRALCREARVPVVFMTTAFLYKASQPPEEDASIWITDLGKWNLSTAAARRGVDAYNEVVRRVARETGARLVDLDAAVPHDRTALVDDVHLTTRGNQLVADAILKTVFAEASPPRE